MFNRTPARKSRNEIMDLTELERRVLLSTVTAPAVSVLEANGPITAPVTLTLDGPAAAPTTIKFQTKNGTAKAGKDYTAAKGSVTIPAGQTSATINVTILGNTTYNGNRAFTVSLKGPKGVTVPKKGVAVNVTDDEAAPVLTLKDVTVTEGANKKKTTAFVVASLDHASTRPVSFSYATANDTATTAGKDYKAAKGKVTLKAGRATATVKVSVQGDATPEPDEVFDVNASKLKGATLAPNGFSRVVIKDDDGGVTRPTATLTANANSVTAGQPAGFTVTLSAPAPAPVSIRYATADGSATAGNGYTQTYAVLDIPAGATAGAFTIPTNAVGTAGTFSVTLSDPANVTLANPSATQTTTGGTTEAFSVNDASAFEGNAGTTNLVFTVSIPAPLTTAVTVDYATATDTAAANPAAAGTDYTPVSGTLTIPAGQTSATISVPVLGNTAAQPDRTFLLNLTNPSAGVTVADGQGVGVILDDDGGGNVTPAQADFNGDGHPDLLVRNVSTGAFTVWLMNGTTRIGTVPLNAPASNNVNDEAIGTGDFNRDGHPDVVLVNVNSGAITIWQQTGANSENTARVFTVAANSDLNYKGAGVADFNNDGTPDILFRNILSGPTGSDPGASPDGGKDLVWVMDGFNHASDAFLPQQPSALESIVGTGDYNGDGNTDVYFRNAMTGAITVQLLDGHFNQTGSIVPVGSTDILTGSRPETVVPLDGTAPPELIFRQFNDGGQNTVWVNSDPNTAVALPADPDLNDQFIGSQVL